MAPRPSSALCVPPAALPPPVATPPEGTWLTCPDPEPLPLLVPLFPDKDGYCRLCWQQARYEAKLAGGLKRGAVGVLAAAGTLECHQLFFDRMKVRRTASPVRRYG